MGASTKSSCSWISCSTFFRIVTVRKPEAPLRACHISSIVKCLEAWKAFEFRNPNSSYSNQPLRAQRSLAKWLRKRLFWDLGRCMPYCSRNIGQHVLRFWKLLPNCAQTSLKHTSSSDNDASAKSIGHLKPSLPEIW